MMTTLIELAARHPLSISVETALAGQPLPEIIAHSTGLSREDAELLVRRGGVWHGRERINDAGWRPAAGLSLALHTPPGGQYEELALGPQDLLYEDEWLLALNKQPGWYSVATPWDLEANVEAALGRFFSARGGQPPQLHLAHRLDRETSGVLLISRRPEINARLQVLFDQGAVDKRYVALAAGRIEPDQVEVHTGHGRGASGLFRLYPLELVGSKPGPARQPIREARTSFRVLERLAGATLVEAQLHTGRTHQIRLHLAWLGHPILGDRRYGGPALVSGLELSHQLLHAGELKLAHPASGTPLALHAPLPALFAHALEVLRAAA